MKALIADDDPVNRDILSRMLAHVGWDCDAVADGRAAVFQALAGGYDAVLLDLFMPEMDGFEAARRIREGGSGAVLLAVSGADEGDRALESGFDRCLQKPYTLDALREVMRGIGKAG